MAGRKGQNRWYSGVAIMEPTFRLEAGATAEGVEYRDLFIQTFEEDASKPGRWRSRPESDWHHLARLFLKEVVTYPVFTNPHAKRYLHPRHGQFKTVVHENCFGRVLPESWESAVSTVEDALLWRAFNSCTYGLGFTKELDDIWRGLSRLPGLNTIVVAEDHEFQIVDTAVRVPQDQIDRIRRSFERTARKMREIASQGRTTHIRNALLAPLDPNRFPPIVQVNPEGQLVEVRLDHGRQNKQAARAGRSATVKAVRTNVETLAAEAPEELIELHAEIERATLQQMIEKFEDMLKKDLPESAWQKFFERNIFILTMAFARPVRLLHTQFHAQSAGLDGRGALVGDFLFAEQGFGIAIVEIKKPASPLMGAQPYRNTKVFSPSAELTGGVMQVLHQRNKIRENWLPHSRDSELLKNSRPDAIKCVVVAGMLPKDDFRRQSFEVFRDANKDIEVITFDELLGKLKLLLEHLTPRMNASIEVSEDDLPF